MTLLATTPAAERDRVFRRLLVWGLSLIVLAPVATWLIFLLPGG